MSPGLPPPVYSNLVPNTLVSEAIDNPLTSAESQETQPDVNNSHHHISDVNRPGPQEGAYDSNPVVFTPVITTDVIHS